MGRPLPGVQVKIDQDELLVRGRDAVMKGYFNRPEASAEAFPNGWFHTGDLACMDADGYLYIVDRKWSRCLPSIPTSPTPRWSACPTRSMARRSRLSAEGEKS